MPNIQEILKQIQRDMSCPICGSKFSMKDIKVRAAFDHTIIIETICAQGHLTMFMTVFRPNPVKPGKQINTNELLDLTNQINNFNGDFEKLWKI
jgi:C4-type Zn-finger protein